MLSSAGRRRAAWFVIGALTAALLLITMVSIVQTREIAATIRASQKQRADTFNLLLDCTQPDGKCFQRGQRQTAKAVSTINEVTVYAAACAARRSGQTAEQIRTCVMAELAKDKRRNR